MKKISFALLLFAAAAIAACSHKQPQQALTDGSVWQNGNEVYIAEDSASFWQLWGGTLHEGGLELKLTHDGKWLVPVIVDNRPTDSVAGTWTLQGKTIVLTGADRKVSRLNLVDGLVLASRDEMAAKALPALDSIQQISVYRELEGTYRDAGGKRWVFSGNTVKRMGLGTAEPYSVGKSLDMNDSVIFTNNIAYAYRVVNGGLQLYKAEYVDSASVWKYKFDGKPVVVLKKQ